MPFKSKAQMRWMYAAEERGEVPKGTARRWAEHTKSIRSLPAKKGSEANSDPVTSMIDRAILGIVKTLSEEESRKDVIRAALLGGVAGGGFNMLQGSPIVRGMLLGAVLGAGGSLADKQLGFSKYIFR